MVLSKVGLVGLCLGHVRGSRSALAQVLWEESSFHLSRYAEECQRQAVPSMGSMLTDMLLDRARDLLGKCFG